MTTTHGSYKEVLQVRGFPSFLWMQFLNAFNDNVYKFVVSLLAVVVTRSGALDGTYVSAAGFIFVAPFLIFSAYAGQLADRYEKRTVVIITKAIEIVAMVLATVALLKGDISWMLAILFFTGAQAAFFSPAKYGIIPELVDEHQLARANGLLEMSTFVAIILGTVAGTYMVDAWRHQPIVIGAALMGVAVLGTLASFRVPHTPAPAQRRPFSWNPLGDVVSGMRRLKSDRILKLTVLGTTFFWFLGALLQLLLMLFGKETLHCSDTQIGLLIMSLAIGIGVGSMLAGKLSGDKVEPGLVPVGAFGMAASGFVVAFACHTLVPAMIGMTALGLTGGVFIVPLNAILQHRPHPDEKGRILATANFVNTVGVILASAVLWILHEQAHLSAAMVIALGAAATVVMAAFAMQLIPDVTVRLLLFLLTRTIYRIRITGIKNVPAEGAALLVANHVSYVDGFLIGACVSRIVRFMVGEKYFDRFRPFFRLFRAIRVPEGNRRAIVTAIQMAREELRRGELVCIFAEGALTLSGNIGEFHRGLEKIVDGLNVPVIPVHLGQVWGSIFSLDRRASLWRSIRKLPFPISVSFGTPMHAPVASQVRQAVGELGAEAASHAIADHDTLATRFFRTARRNWSKRAMIESSGRTLTYGQALIASHLLGRKLNRDEEMIGVLLPAGAIANLAIVGSGRAVVNLNFTAGREGLDSAIRQCNLRTIITARQFLKKANIDSRPEMIFVEDLMQFTTSAKLGAFVRARFISARSQATADSLAAILFSSGSTGTPKGVMLSHRNLIANTDAVNHLYQIDSADTITGVLPFFHAFGFTFTLWFPLLHGASAAYHPNPLDAKGVGELVKKSSATFLPSSPTFCQVYLRGCSKEQFSSLKFVLAGAERLNPALAQAFEEKFGLPLLEGYGVTEMAPVISVNVPNRERVGVKQIGCRPGTVGQPVPGVAAKLVHCESGGPVSVGETGLLLVKGPNRMLGYLDRPQETEAVLRDGWYVTGDIVRISDDGFIQIVDRHSRFSKIGGEMVPHAKIEDVLNDLVPDSRSAVVAVPDARKGERLVAFVSGTESTPQEIWSKLVTSGLPNLWIPKVDDIRLIVALPLLGTGKLDLAAVKRMAAKTSSESVAPPQPI